jgi:hypothetical protein
MSKHLRSDCASEGLPARGRISMTSADVGPQPDRVGVGEVILEIGGEAVSVAGGWLSVS